MNRQSIQSRGAASGTGVSVKSAKSGKSNHSQWSNNLGRNMSGHPGSNIGIGSKGEIMEEENSPDPLSAQKKMKAKIQNTFKSD